MQDGTIILHTMHMEQVPQARLPHVRREACTDLSERVSDYLQAIPWGRHNYPTNLLAMSNTEQAVLTAVEDGMTVRAVAESVGRRYGTVHSDYTTALGKQQATEGLDDNILAVRELGQRVIILNHIFGVAWQGANKRLATVGADVVIKATEELDGMLGNTWRASPGLALQPKASLEARIEKYDVLLGEKWRSSPVILTQNPEVVAHRAKMYDQLFGDDWREVPSIVTNRLQTVLSSKRALKTIGVTRENTQPTPFYALLSTTVANKRAKVDFIRQQILGHEQVRICNGVRPLSEIVSERLSQTPEARALEVREVAELEAFVRHMGARGLAQSLSAITAWALKHGYTVKDSTIA